MNLHELLSRRAASAGPVRVGVIGAGKFASMFLTQVLHTPEVHVVGVADLDVGKARAALARTGWPAERYAADSFASALRTGGTHVSDSADDLIAVPGLEAVLEITGSPLAGTRHAELAIDAGRHVIMVNVEADCLAGPVLAEKARAAGVVYSMAYGDQPALISELVDWCRTAGFDVAAAGKGTKYLPEYLTSTPDTVSGLLRLHRRAAGRRRLQPEDVQLLPRRHQVGDRDGGRGQRDRPDPAGRGTAVPAGGRR